MNPKMIAFLCVAALGAGGVLLACGKENPAAPDAEEEAIDASLLDGGVIDADCVMSPVTSAQILNACTTAQRIEKHPVLPLQLEDGGLPPLP